jgi:hypothetical protein
MSGYDSLPLLSRDGALLKKRKKKNAKNAKNTKMSKTCHRKWFNNCDGLYSNTEGKLEIIL